MRDWVPVPGTTKERLIRAALHLFGIRDYDDVSVHDLANEAGVTTGSLYHHFGNKLELFEIVRTDVERRVADRVGAVLDATAPDSPLDVALLTGYDWTMRQGFAKLLGASHADDATGELHRVIQDAVGTSLATLSLAAWRSAVLGAARSPQATGEFRHALGILLRGARSAT